MQTTIAKKSLKELRKENLLSQADVAKIVGISQAKASRFERGTQVPDAQERARFEQLYSTPEIRWIDGNQVDLKWIRYTNPNDPAHTLKWWREHRHLSIEELSKLSGISQRTINNWERGAVLTMRPKNRRTLAKALMIAPDKLVLPGDEESLDPGYIDRTANLRAELRGARRALRKAYDILSDDAAITHRYQQRRDNVMPDIVRELKGT